MSLSGCLFSAFDKFRLQFDDFVFGKTCYSNNVFDWIVADKHCLGVVFLPLQVRPLFLVKHVRHSVNLVQKRFVGIPFQRYIFSEVLVKKSLQSTNENPELCKQLLAKNRKKFFAGSPCMNYREAA